MPYKDKDKARQASREAMQKKRQGLTSLGINNEGLTYPDDQAELTARGLLWCDILPGDRVRRPWFVYGVGWTIQEAPRFLTLSDGQILDRYNQPQPKPCPIMIRLNRAGTANLAKEVSPVLRQRLVEIVKTGKN